MQVTITDQQLDQASKNLEANPLVSSRVKLEKLLWGPLAAPWGMHTDVVVGADLVRSGDSHQATTSHTPAVPLHQTALKPQLLSRLLQVYPMNVDTSLQALLATLQALSRPTLLAYVERLEAVTHSLERGLRSLRQHRCRRLRLSFQTTIYALDAWAQERQSEDSSLACRDVQSLSWS
jgi:hypothetical protein